LLTRQNLIGGTVIIAVLCAMSMAVLSAGEVSPRCAGVFASNMVLPRDVPVPVWGRSARAVDVTVTFAERSKTVKADPFGQWAVRLGPMPASAHGRELVVTSGAGQLTLTNVLVGEVWIVAGAGHQPLGGNASATGGMRTNLAVRVLPLSGEMSSVPQPDLTGRWHGLSEAEGAPLTSDVAACFAAQLREKLNVPIGVISAPTVRRMSFESMIPVEGFEAVPGLETIAEQSRTYNPLPAKLRERNDALVASVKAWVAVAEDDWAHGRPMRTLPEQDVPRIFFSSPSVLYHGMIHPLARFPVRGVIWCGRGPDTAEPALYDKKIEAMIRGWRKSWQAESLPFCFVRAASEDGASDGHVKAIAKAEDRIITDIRNTGMLLPGNPDRVGKRLAGWALEAVYGLPMAAKEE
jgi:sialate O-acetylesterase